MRIASFAVASVALLAGSAFSAPLSINSERSPDAKPIEPLYGENLNLYGAKYLAGKRAVGNDEKREAEAKPIEPLYGENLNIYGAKYLAGKREADE